MVFTPKILKKNLRISLVVRVSYKLGRGVYFVGELKWRGEDFTKM